MKQFGIGEEVKITYPGCVCSTFREAADRMGAIHWECNRGEVSGHLKYGMIGIITNKWKDCYLIRLSDGYDYVFHGGFEIYKKAEIQLYGICEFVKKYYDKI